VGVRVKVGVSVEVDVDVKVDVEVADGVNSIVDSGSVGVGVPFLAICEITR